MTCFAGSRIQNLAGKAYGRFTAIHLANRINGQTAWLCECSGCGQSVSVKSSSLKRGKHTEIACGCFVPKRRHGLKHTPEYAAWHGMKMRTTNAKLKNADRYVGRGVRVCDRWAN